VCVWPGTGERCPEGPHIFKKGEYYYAMLAEGGTGYGHGINVARSKNLYGPYEESPYNPVLRQFNPDAPIQRTGHGNIIETQCVRLGPFLSLITNQPSESHVTGSSAVSLPIVV